MHLFGAYLSMALEEIKGIPILAYSKFKKVKRLELFGSLACGGTSTDSDVDLLVEFEELDQRLSDRNFGLLRYFEDTLGCEVDLLTINSLKNPYLRRRILAEKITIYER